jgi:hypothetical protein
MRYNPYTAMSFRTSVNQLIFIMAAKLQKYLQTDEGIGNKKEAV